ncbi:MAG: ABC transporter permease [Selenomonadaceae bacterium]|nr:ABC transporter permease [Selenomonadaceae bacterium]
MIKLYKTLFRFIGDIIANRKFLWDMTKRDFRQRYLGSYLGILWAFIQPTITVMIFWFVFQVGFKAVPVDNFPFILWLVCGMFPWFFLSESIQSATTSVIESAFLVKKIVFRVEMLPIVKIVSALVVHLFFVLILFAMFAIYGYSVSIYNLQIIYYLFAMICLSLGLSWLTSSLTVFLRDVGQFVSMILQFGFWGTPIFWSLQMIPEEFHFILKLNPAYYLVEGYRQSFIYHEWFWEHIYLTGYFWALTLTAMLAGAWCFKRLRPHFADVL